MNKKKHDASRIIKTAAGAVLAVAAAALSYANNHVSLKSAAVSENIPVGVIGDSMADNKSNNPHSTDNDSAAPSRSALININTATAEELQTLAGMGEVKTAAVIAYREEHGGFSDISEIMNVSGIGEKMFENIRGSITTGENTAIPGTSASSAAADVPEVFPININTATLEELQTLSGIGEAKAAAIIAYREEYGIFNDISGIMNVSGIGGKIFEEIRGQITV